MNNSIQPEVVSLCLLVAALLAPTDARQLPILLAVCARSGTYERGGIVYGPKKFELSEKFGNHDM